MGPRRAAMLALLVCAVACTRPQVDAETPRTTTTVTSTSLVAFAPGTVVTTDAISPTSIVTSVPPRTAAPSTSITTTVPATTVPATTVPVTTVPAIRTLSIAATGDVLAHSPLWGRAADNARAAGGTGFDFDPMLAGLRPLIEPADLAICHLETPIAPVGAALQTAPRYAVPAEVVDAIAHAGYDRCSTASNHALDQGPEGIARTIEVLERNQLGQSGMARTRDEIAPAVFETDGVRVSHLSYTFSYNGLSLPYEEHWRSALIDPMRIVGDAVTARQMGAEVVIVSLHWGVEGVHEPSEYQRRVADEITRPGVVDLVIGHHAHVVQPIEQINGTWVVFGLGNILSNMPAGEQWPAASQDAIVATIDLEVSADGLVFVHTPRVHPTWVDRGAGWEVQIVADQLARDDLDAGRRAELERSLARTAAVVGTYLAPVA